ncbi:MAG: ferrochelatase [Hyphomonadaceae bacterium]|nr:ferrochelatase [Hyphomonadaceae bacterium]
MARKIAIVLFNLGGPDRAEAIQPFLQNLFSDPAIIRAPAPVRWLVSRLISRSRAPAVTKNYALMDQPGGGSPLLPETKKQAHALEEVLSTRMPDAEIRCFIAMRYWHPYTEEAAAEVLAWAPDETVLLPLYPQFSSTTTGSSLTEWQKHYPDPVRTLCCYPFSEKLIAAHAEKVLQAWCEAGEPKNVRLLMSAHGLPESVVKAGDPYQWQVEQMAERLCALMPADWEKRVCYQSRVGPLKWIGPSTDEEIVAAGEAGRHVIVSPIAFVSDHIETLVELGVEYRELALEKGVSGYTTVPALGVHEKFIAALADEVEDLLAAEQVLRSCVGGRLCPKAFGDCPNRNPLAMTESPESNQSDTEHA